MYFSRFHLEADVDLDTFAEKCPSNLTGADYYALCSDAMLNTMKRKIKQLEAGTVPLKILSNELSFFKNVIFIFFFLLCLFFKYNNELFKISINKLHLVGKNVDEKEILVSLKDFDEALENLTPSLTDSEIQRYRQLRKSFSNDKDHQIRDNLVTGQLLPDNIA